jgi:hypothetical protein
VLFLVVWFWRSGASKARQARQAARAGTRLLSLTGRVAGITAVIIVAQWLVITYWRDNLTLLLTVLAVPAVFAAWVLAKALTVTSWDDGSHRSDRR